MITGERDKVPAERTEAAADSRSPDFNRLMQSQNFDLADDFKASISTTLSQKGYQIIQAAGPTEHYKGNRANGRRLSDDYVKALSVDAVLYCAVKGGMYEDGIDGGLVTPSVSINFDLVDALTGEVIFKQFYDYTAYGNTPPGYVTTVRPDDRFAFSSFSDVFGDPARAAQGLRAAAPAIAEAIGRAMTKKPSKRSDALNE